MPFIYVIKNDINDKVYVGKTMQSVQKRFKQHCNESKRERSKDRPLYRSMRKYGVEHFFVEQLEECEYKVLEEREIYWIDKIGSYKYGYNATRGGDGKPFVDRNKVISLYDGTRLNSEQIANQCGCSEYSVREIVSEFFQTTDWTERVAQQNRKMVRYVETGQIFQSLQQASQWLNEQKRTNYQHSSHIRKVCDGKRKTCGGFHWEDVEQDDQQCP